MLYLQNSTKSQVLVVPTNGITPGNGLRLKVRSTIDLEEVTLEVTAGESSDQYAHLSVTLPDDMSQGEYEYILDDARGVISTGLLILGNYEGSVQEYETEIVYKQYGE